MKFRKKPVVIDAIQFLGNITCQEIYEFAGIEVPDGDPWPPPFRFNDGKIYIKTLEGEMAASCGDWIIKGVKGEFYPCKPDVFQATYEAV